MDDEKIIADYYKIMRERKRRNIFLTFMVLSGLFYIVFTGYWLFGQAPPSQVDFESETVTIIVNSLSGFYIFEFLPTAIAYFVAGIIRIIGALIIRSALDSGKVMLILTIVTLIIVSGITGRWILVILEVASLVAYRVIIIDWYGTVSY